MRAVPPNASGRFEAVSRRGVRTNRSRRARHRGRGSPDAVERRRRDERQPGGAGAGVSPEQKIDCDEHRSAHEERTGRAGRAGLSVRRLEQLERDCNDQRARGEREHPGRQPRRRCPEATEGSADDERSARHDGIEDDLKHERLDSRVGVEDEERPEHGRDGAARPEHRDSRICVGTEKQRHDRLEGGGGSTMRAGAAMQLPARRSWLPRPAAARRAAAEVRQRRLSGSRRALDGSEMAAPPTRLPCIDTRRR
jgi:hypothetical protein